MPYVGGQLAPLFDSTPAKATLALMAHKGGDRMVELTVENTPIALGLGSGGGNLRTSWYQRRVRRVRRGPLSGWESGVATDVDYAPHVEFGTGLWGPEHRKYLIVPKKPGGWLAWRGPGGEMIFARRVMHPGSPGQHMVATAAAAVEIEMMDGTLFNDLLHEWVRAQEALV